MTIFEFSLLLEPVFVVDGLESSCKVRTFPCLATTESEGKMFARIAPIVNNAKEKMNPMQTGTMEV